jgi:uncharacterized membrane protein
METIHLKNKTSYKLRIALAVGVLLAFSLFFSYLIIHNSSATASNGNVFELMEISIIILFIVVLPLVIFIFQGSNAKKNASLYSKKREAVYRRRRHTSRIAGIGKKSTKLF